MPTGLVITISSEKGTIKATFLPVIVLTPTPTWLAGLTPPSATQSAVGISSDTGTEVFADTDSGTRRASDMTADCSDALLKIGSVIVGGRSCVAVLASAVALMGI